MLRVLVPIGIAACGFSTTAPAIDATIDASPDASIDAPDADPCPSTNLTCPTGYVRVPNNCAFTAGEFCIMKYEAKQSGTTAVSTASGQPWGAITVAAAKTACALNGAGYHLITNEEWQATARAIEATPENWSTTATPFLSKGKTDDCQGPCPTNPACPSPAAADDNPCVGVTTTGDCTDRAMVAFRYNRTHRIGTNGVIWDFAGNMFELVDHPRTYNETQGMSTGQDINSTTGSSFTPALDEAKYKSANLAHTDVPTVSMSGQPVAQNIGILYVTGTSATQPRAEVFTRGGDFCGFAGIYSVSLLRDQELGVNVGFRCVYKP